MYSQASVFSLLRLIWLCVVKPVGGTRKAEYCGISRNSLPSVVIAVPGVTFTQISSVPGPCVCGAAIVHVTLGDLDTAIPGLAGTADDNGTDPTYGVGLQYRFNDAVALRGEYSRFEVEDLDVDLAQVQARFDF